MERVSQTFSYDLLDRDELSIQEADDLTMATEARKNARTHVSGFGVGACLRMNNGDVTVGWNWENNVHTTLHAEKNAIGRLAEASRQSGLKRVTVVGAPVGVESEEICPPCGCCRQDLLELWKPGSEPLIIMAGTRGRITRIKFADLVPLLFDLNKYKK